MMSIWNVLSSVLVLAIFVQSATHARQKRQVSLSFGFPGQNGQNPRPVNVNDFLGLGGLFGQPNTGQGGLNLAGLFGQPNGCAVNNGGCEHGCRMVRGRRQCYCFDGYLLNNLDGTCQDIDECLEFNPCNGPCVNSIGSYSCSSNGGGGASSCANANGGCQQGCQDTPQGPQCLCGPGFQLSPQDGRSCIQSNQQGFGNCRQQRDLCSHRCQDTPSGPVCLCRPTFVLQDDGVTCDCPPNFELVGRRCRAATGGFPGGGAGGGDCNNPPNGGCEHRCNVNRRGIKKCACRANFILREDQLTCECPAPFSLNRNGRQCRQDDSAPAPLVESCNVDNGGCDHNCRMNNRGKVICRCNRGFTLAEDGKSCISDTPVVQDPCATNNGRCEHICNNNNGSPACSCRPGFQLINGQRCLEAAPPQTPPPLPTPGPTPGPTPPQHTPGPTQSGCGTNNKKSLFRRIVGGKPADPKDWPWMAAILRLQTQDSFCGGVLITDRHVLTAAHCLVDFKKDEVLVRLGEYNFDTKDDNSPTDFKVVDIRLHEGYNRSSQENDIAVMKLDRPSSFSEFIWPVCLPPGEGNFEDQLGYVTGWGTTSFGGQVSRVLQEVVLPVWAQPECEKAYPGKITGSMMCAGERAGGKDSCQGDSGGPFLVQIYPSQRWFVIGVVSWGIKCAEAGNPGVYTRVNNFLPWIRTNAVF